jgi:ADP-heptose:LPS heptosyltransferase
MDLVVTVDTSLAHLSGALGRPTRVLLCWAADWRWLLDRSDSPWYTTARLIRHPAPGDWEAVMQQLQAMLPTALKRSESVGD